MKDPLKDAKEKLSNMETDPAAFWESECLEAYDEMLEECCKCEYCGRGGSNLKEEDPLAYRCGFSDWVDASGKDFAQQQDAYKELADAIEAVEDKLSELEELL